MFAGVEIAEHDGVGLAQLGDDRAVRFGVPIVAWEFPVFGIVAATPVVAAAALIVRAGGRIWDGLDPSREVLGGSG